MSKAAAATAAACSGLPASPVYACSPEHETKLYANQCEARAAGAALGECPDRPLVMCSTVMLPVSACAPDGTVQTYSNVCLAQARGAEVGDACPPNPFGPAQKAPAPPPPAPAPSPTRRTPLWPIALFVGLVAVGVFWTGARRGQRGRRA